MFEKLLSVKKMIEILSCLTRGFCAIFHFGFKVGRLKILFACKISFEPRVGPPEDELSTRWINNPAAKIPGEV